MILNVTMKNIENHELSGVQKPLFFVRVFAFCSGTDSDEQKNANHLITVGFRPMGPPNDFHSAPREPYGFPQWPTQRRTKRRYLVHYYKDTFTSSNNGQHHHEHKNAIQFIWSPLGVPIVPQGGP